MRDCAQDTGTCYNTVVSPIYFVSFVLTAQFVLVNVVIAVLMKHLEESNKEAKEEAELEAEMMELEMEAGDIAARSPQLNPLTLGMDRSSSGGSPWRSPRGVDTEQERDGPMDSPTADITRDSVGIRAESPSCTEPQLEVKNLVAKLIFFFSLCLSKKVNLYFTTKHHYYLPDNPIKKRTDLIQLLSLACTKLET